ncbi:GntR family transcriptional regulator [Granulosicoccus sp.]|nr:GntR family transcriptional regulator [Granulosicoccus sp.]MDB4224554.1 GntR family transcriptional regulator [Granulosicoccus sp.]
MSVGLNNLSVSRRTVADELFDAIRNDIDKMRLVPGTKITETELAKLYNVSRQPVREAFIRLDNLSLLEIRPQKATIVRRISKSAIQQARFVRVAVEVEVARRACLVNKPESIAALELILEQQSVCLKNKNIPKFNALDQEFHTQICLMADCEFAVDVIADCKAKVARLCILSLANDSDADKIYIDHIDIMRHLSNKDEDKLVQSIRDHLSRLDSTIEFIQTEHRSYFED